MRIIASVSSICVFLVNVAAVFGQQHYISGYAGSWSNVSGQAADFYLSGEANPNAPLTIYDVLLRKQADLEVPLQNQTLDPNNTEALEKWLPVGANDHRYSRLAERALFDFPSGL